MSKIVIVGARGQLGADLARELASRHPVCLDRAALDVRDGHTIDSVLGDLKPSIVLNTAAYNQVDLAEDEPEEAFRVNALAPRFLAKCCRATGALLVHFSTNYVFSGDARAPYDEKDRPAPLSVYAGSKLAGETLVRNTAPLHMVIRTSGLYGAHGRGGKGGNFVEAMLRAAAENRKIRVVEDQVLTPTFTGDLAAKVVSLLDLWEDSRAPGLLGLYHVTNAGSCSWFEFAREIFQQRGVSADLEPVSSLEYRLPAKRPAYAVLAAGHLQRLGLDDMRDWREALAEYLTILPASAHKPQLVS